MIEECLTCGGATKMIAGKYMQCIYCKKVYSIKDNDLVPANSDSLLSEATRLASSNNIENVKMAQEILLSIISFPGSGELYDKCERSIADYAVNQERIRLDSLRREEEEKIRLQEKEARERTIKNIKIGAVALAILIVFIVISLCIITNKNRSERYIEACKLYDDEEYVNAYSIFSELRNYRDSWSYVDKIEVWLRQASDQYTRALGFRDIQEYKVASDIFESILTYEDSLTYFEECNDILLASAKKSYSIGAYEVAIATARDVNTKSNSYSEAIDLIKQCQSIIDRDILSSAQVMFDDGDYEGVVDALSQIHLISSYYAEAKVLSEKAAEIVTAQQIARAYEDGKNAYSGGDWVTAQSFFLKAGTLYEDVADYIDVIGSNLYAQAYYYINVHDFDNALAYVSYIDSEDEWTKYQEALELKGYIKSEYVSTVLRTAEAKYVSEGFTAMEYYLRDSEKEYLMSEEDYHDIVEKYSRISVMDLQPYYSSGYSDFRKVNVTDREGLDYQNSITGSCENSYRINGEFTKLEGRFFKTTVDSSDSCILSIYGADHELLIQISLRYSKTAEQFSVDITGLNNVTIEFTGCDYVWGNKTYAAVADFVFVR